METCYCYHMLRKRVWLSFNVLNKTWGGKSAGWFNILGLSQSAFNLIIGVADSSVTRQQFQVLQN